LKTHLLEHYPSSTAGVFSAENDSKIAIIVVANKYSPTNFWNGRWRSAYLYDPSSGSITGKINVDVHYYEDGNVRLLTDKEVGASGGSSATEVIKAIAGLERKYQEEVNRGFVGLSEGAFKNLRRNLPVSRSKMVWERWEGMKIGYVQLLLLDTDADLKQSRTWWRTIKIVKSRMMN
jgi:capping protein alpha